MLRRTARECAADVIAAARATRGVSRVRAPLVVAWYFLGMAVRPLQSERLVGLDVRGPDGPVHTVVRLSASDVKIWRMVFLRRIHDFPYADVRTVVDLGAHAGLAATWFASRYPTARIVCVEPMRENVAVLREASRRAGGTWAIEHAAVAGASGTTPFYCSRWWTTGSAVAHVGSARQARQDRLEQDRALPVRSVPAITMQDLVARHHLERIDVLKIDIEGAEEALICEGDTSWLERVRYIAVEIHDEYVDGDRVRRALHDAGFTERHHDGECSVFVSRSPAARPRRPPRVPGRARR